MSAAAAQYARPQVVAHRGSSLDEAEHTRAAYARALEEGSEALECDVRLTADGHLVCVHDRRVDRTSSGRGVVSTLPLAELERWDFRSWKQPWADLDDELDDELGDELSGGPPGAVLTFEGLCAMVRDHPRPVQIAVETKHPTRYAGLVERRLVEVLRRFGWSHAVPGRPPPVRVMSFSWMSLRRVREWAPSVPTVFLMDRMPIRYRDGSLPLGSRIAGPSIDIVRAHPSYVAKVHARGHQVHVWTVNDVADLELCVRLGVEAVITDKPAELLRHLEAAGTGGGRG